MELTFFNVLLNSITTMYTLYYTVDNTSFCPYDPHDHIRPHRWELWSTSACLLDMGFCVGYQSLYCFIFCLHLFDRSIFVERFIDFLGDTSSTVSFTFALVTIALMALYLVWICFTVLFFWKVVFIFWVILAKALKWGEKNQIIIQIHENIG